MSSRKLIDEVAADFRLGVVRRAAEWKRDGGGRGESPLGTVVTESSEEVWQAVKTLLQLHDYLQNIRTSEGETPLAVESESRHK